MYRASSLPRTSLQAPQRRRPHSSKQTHGSISQRSEDPLQILGALRALSVEIAHEMWYHLDVESLDTSRLVCSRAGTVVGALPAYRDPVAFAPDGPRALHCTLLSSRRSIG